METKAMFLAARMEVESKREVMEKFNLPRTGVAEL